MEAHKDVQRVGDQVAEVGLKYFCLDYVSKNGVSATACSTLLGSVELHYVTYVYMLTGAEIAPAIQLVRIPRSNDVWPLHSAPHCGSTTLKQHQ